MPSHSIHVSTMCHCSVLMAPCKWHIARYKLVSAYTCVCVSFTTDGRQLSMLHIVNGVRMYTIHDYRLFGKHFYLMCVCIHCNYVGVQYRKFLKSYLSPTTYLV